MMILKKNVGYVDSIIRTISGAVILITGLYIDSWWGFLGLILILSGAVSYCPVYGLLKMETTKPNTERAN